MDSASAKLLITRKRAKLENLLKATVNHEPKRTLTAAKTRGRTGAIDSKRTCGPALNLFGDATTPVAVVSRTHVSGLSCYPERLV
jgi:hypothetical protein